MNLERGTPRLVASTPSLKGAMVRGGQSMVEVTLTNEGGAATGDIKVLLPDAPWLSLASPTTIESLAPGNRQRRQCCCVRRVQIWICWLIKAIFSLMRRVLVPIYLFLSIFKRPLGSGESAG